MKIHSFDPKLTTLLSKGRGLVLASSLAARFLLTAATAFGQGLDLSDYLTPVTVSQLNEALDRCNQQPSAKTRQLCTETLTKLIEKQKAGGVTFITLNP